MKNVSVQIGLGASRVIYTVAFGRRFLRFLLLRVGLGEFGKKDEDAWDDVQEECLDGEFAENLDNSESVIFPVFRLDKFEDMLLESMQRSTSLAVFSSSIVPSTKR